MNKRDLSNTSFAFNLGSTTFFCVIILSTQYQFKYEHYYSYTLLLYILRTYIYISYFFALYIPCINLSMKKWKIKSNQIKSNQMEADQGMTVSSKSIFLMNNQSDSYIGLHFCQVSVQWLQIFSSSSWRSFWSLSAAVPSYFSYPSSFPSSASQQPSSISSTFSCLWVHQQSKSYLKRCSLIHNQKFILPCELSPTVCCRLRRTLPFKLILRSSEVVFWCLDRECCTFWKIDGNSFKSTNTILWL